ncbi:MAG: hypothetical protein KDC44_11595, partial [Phaeodactylibacter sp.]|nr:hypothetical protein [Phaeodactylibacter sp.]
TLERAVTDAVATAQAAATGGSPVSSVDSFEQTYVETSVIEWEILSSAPLQGYTESEWNEFIFHTVDNRELAVNFSLKGDLTDAAGAPVCKEVKITVKYPTKTANNTFILNPVEEGRTTFTYIAPGDLSGGVFNGAYEYQYQVVYTDTDIYTSDWISETKTDITIIPNELGVKKVKFVGSNIPFGEEPSQVKKVRIDFFFERPEGEPNLTQLGEITANDETGHSFESYFRVPITNNYAYRFIYELNDGTVKVLNTQEDFGSPNSNVYTIQSLMKEHTFNLRVAREKNPERSVDEVYLDVQYNDPQNDESLPHAFDWQVDWNGTTSKYQTQAWKFPAIYNPTGASYTLNGEYTDSDWETIQINGVNLQANVSMFKIEPGFAYIGVKVDPHNINWEEVASVNLFIFQKIGGENSGFTRPIVKAVQQRDHLKLQTMDEGIFNIDRNISFIPPTDQVSNDDRYYIVQKPLEETNVEFYYNATYVQKDGTPARDSGEIKVQNKAVLVLPGNGPEGTIPSVHKASFAHKTERSKKAKAATAK